MDSFIKKYSKSTLAVSILLVILALFLIFKPAESLNFIVILLGGILTLSGIIHTISYFYTPSEFKTFSFELVEGIINIVIGLVFILKPELISGILPFIIGAWVVIEGIVRFQLSLNIKDIENSNWFILLLVSVLTISLGLIIIVNPFGAKITITALCGIFLLISEIINIIESIYMIKKF